VYVFFALLQTIIVPVVILNYVFLVLLTSKTRSVSSLDATLFRVVGSLAGGIFFLSSRNFSLCMYVDEEEVLKDYSAAGS
jgi:hypothetical protein